MLKAECDWTFLWAFFLVFIIFWLVVYYKKKSLWSTSRKYKTSTSRINCAEFSKTAELFQENSLLNEKIIRPDIYQIYHPNEFHDFINKLKYNYRDWNSLLPIWNIFLNQNQKKCAWISSRNQQYNYRCWTVGY